MPVHASPYPTASTVDLTPQQPDFVGVDILEFTYRTDPNVVAEILPAPLEMDENATAAILFISYGMTSVGSYLEVVQQVHCRFQGEEVAYIPHIYVTNVPAMLAGREVLGYPKLLADIDFDPRRRTKDALITASLDRPASVPLATAQFRPVSPQTLPDNIPGRVSMNLKVIPSAVAGEPPSVAELVPTVVTIHSGEAWSGQGSLRLTGASDFSPLHNVPVVENLGATLLTQATLSLTPPKETYPL
jgi:acetoacetate decarboxylase